MKNVTGPVTNAKAAREVIARCEFLRDKLREDPVGVAWTAQFSGCLALLRSVGHVLDKVDAATSNRIEVNAKQWWNGLKQSKPEPKIFWEFIEAERNLILKESDIRAGQSAFITPLGVQAVGLVAGEKPKAAPSIETRPPTVTYSYHMNEGAFAGRDPRDVIDEAIDWWLQQISKIETS